MEGNAGESAIHTNHMDVIHDAQLDYYGKILATCSSDRTIKIFDVNASGQSSHVADITGHEGPVWQVCWGHPKFGVVLASCSYDRTIRVWRKDQARGEWGCVFVSRKMELSVNSVCWAPHEHGLTLAAACSSGDVIIIEQRGDSWVETSAFRAHSVGVNAVCWRPVMPVIQSGNASPSKQIVTGGCDNIVRIWTCDPATGDWKETGTLAQHEDWVRDVAWAPNIGIPYEAIATCSQDGVVLVWRSEGQPGSKWTSTLLNKFKEPVWRVSWSITGNILAVTSGENSVTLWKEELEETGAGAGAGAGRRWTCVSDSVGKGTAKAR